jgi:hypothetical protein
MASHKPPGQTGGQGPHASRKGRRKERIEQGRIKRIKEWGHHSHNRTASENRRTPPLPCQLPTQIWTSSKWPAHTIQHDILNQMPRCLDISASEQNQPAESNMMADITVTGTGARNKHLKTFNDCKRVDWDVINTKLYFAARIS